MLLKIKGISFALVHQRQGRGAVQGQGLLGGIVVQGE